MAREMELRRVLKEQQARLLALPNVVGVGIGRKKVRNRDQDTLSIVVMVEQKLPLTALAAESVVPKEIDGIPTDVVEVGKVHSLAGLAQAQEVEYPDVPLAQRREKWRPAHPGVSIGHYKITAGTFGAVVIDRRTKKPLLLSNNHVLANSSGGCGRHRRAKKGDPILQPGSLDGGTSEDMIGKLERFVPLKMLENKRVEASMLTDTSAPNYVDAAVAKPLKADDIKTSILGIGEVAGITEPALGMRVQKSGRTTGHSWGTVEYIEMAVQVDYGEGRVATFEGQIGCSAMSRGGDSGSVVLDERRRAVGLLFAGSPLVTICSPIIMVLDMLKVDFPS
ncbi:MAG TPA: hypothetical protein PLC26_07130 [Bacillota bacterium]|jgi:hypothetical protein|nr:hypothetical protein [Bacillota bacterium]